MPHETESQSPTIAAIRNSEVLHQTCLILVDTFRAGLAGPVVLAVATWDPSMSLVACVTYILGLAASFFGPLANQGAAQLEGSTQQKLTHEHSFSLTATISLLNRLQRGQFTAERYQQQTLKEIATIVNTVAHAKNSKVLACLLIEQNRLLTLVSWSGHREGRIPSASIPIDTRFGAAATFRTGKTQHIPDIQLSNLDEFNGKSYRSVLTFPVRIDGEVVGVVTIDSTVPNHFDNELVGLEVHIRPFVELLAFSIAEISPGA